MYPKNLTNQYAYLESRGGIFPETVFFGLQEMLLKYFEGFVFTYQDILDAETFLEDHFGSANVFNKEAWLRLYDAHHGMLPLRIKAVEEGTIVPTRNVIMTVENTDPEFPWLTTFFEDYFLHLWYPITIASQSHYLRQQIRSIGVNASDNIDDVVDFMVHDFGYRGTTGEEAAQRGGAAHLLSFKGTDTIAGIRFLQEWYRDSSIPEMYGFSVPAAEHSVIMSHKSEEEAFRHILEAYPAGILSVVSDTYDYQNAVSNLWGGVFRDQVRERKGRIVIRPDSGDPVATVLWTLHELENNFGWTLNSKLFKVLPDYVRVIQGDGMDVESIPSLYRAIVKEGFAPENVIVGSGGGLLQNVTRDTLKFAFKVSESRYADGTVRATAKSPKGDKGKTSKSGRLALIYNNGEYETVPETPEIGSQNILTTVFENGIMVRDTSYQNIVNRMRGLQR